MNSPLNGRPATHGPFHDYPRGRRVDELLLGHMFEVVPERDPFNGKSVAEIAAQESQLNRA